MASYFITGASRGLGLDLVRELVNKPVSEVSIVYAGARTRTEGLEKLSSDARGRIEIVHLDVESEESVKTAASLVEHSRGPQGLDVLINVAGVMTHFPEGVTTM